MLIATGSGIAPLRAMIEAETRRGDDGPEMILLFGCRTSQDLLFNEQLDAFAARLGRFHYVPTLSQPEEGWRGRTGYVQAHLPELLEHLEEPALFVCGHGDMVRDVRELACTQLDVPADRIRTERH